MSYVSFNRKYTINTLSICFIVAISALLTSCGTMQTYSGMKLQKAEVATIKPEFQVLGNLTIISVDDKKLELGFDKVEVLPGQRKINLGWGKQGYRFAYYQDLYFFAEAGHVYIVRGNAGWGKPIFWIEDNNNGNVVAGNKPLSGGATPEKLLNQPGTENFVSSKSTDDLKKCIFDNALILYQEGGLNKLNSSTGSRGTIQILIDAKPNYQSAVIDIMSHQKGSIAVFRFSGASESDETITHKGILLNKCVDGCE